MKIFLILFILLTPINSESQEQIAIYTDTLNNNGYIYTEKTDWTCRQLVCTYALGGNFSIHGRVVMKENYYYLSSASLSEEFMRNRTTYFIKNFKIKKTQNRIKIKIQTATYLKSDEMSNPSKNKLKRSLIR